MSNGTDYTPERWLSIARSAKALLLKDRKNARALAWFRAALPHVAAQRESARVQAFYEDMDPGWLASFGLGAADVASFGLGPLIARGIDPGAANVQQAARTQHPTANLAGQIAGVVGPAGVELGLVKAGRLAPSAVRVAVNAIKNRTGRLAAKTALNAAEGAAYAGAQAAGHTEGGLLERAQAAGEAAPFGAAGGAVIGAIPGAVRVAKRPAKAMLRQASNFLDDLAGKAVPKRVPLDFDLLPPTTRPPISLAPTPKTAPDPMDVPTFIRRAAPPATGGANQPRPGHPLFSGERSYTRSAEVRGGAPLTPSADPNVMALVRQQPFAEIQRILNDPTTPKAVQDLLYAELSRRGIFFTPSLLQP